MTENVEFLQKVHDKLAADNEASYNQLRQKIPNIEMNSSDARLNCLIEALTGTVWTTEDRLKFEISFHRGIEKALAKAWERVRDQEKGRLIVPKKRGDGGLIVPR